MTHAPTVGSPTDVLARVLNGDAHALTELWELDDQTVADVWPQFGDPPVLTAASVVRVLRSLGSIDDELARRWATFMRIGQVPDPTRPTGPSIDVDFEAAVEEEIVDALACLNELGDAVDGTISDAKRAALIAALLEEP